MEDFLVFHSRVLGGFISTSFSGTFKLSHISAPCCSTELVITQYYCVYNHSESFSALKLSHLCASLIHPGNLLSGNQVLQVSCAFSPNSSLLFNLPHWLLDFCFVCLFVFVIFFILFKCFA